MSSIQDYNRHIADLLMHSYRQMIERENHIARGGGMEGCPLPIMGCQEPPMCIEGGKLNMKKVGRAVLKGVSKVGNTVVNKAATIVERAATKAANKMADKAVDYLIDSLNNNNANQVAEAEGGVIRKRGRAKHEDRAKHEEVEEVEGGKFNFIKAISHVGSKVGNQVVNAVANKAINKGKP